MKVSEITPKIVADYVKDSETPLMQSYIDAAISFIKNYTSLSEDDINEHDDFYIVVLILCEDMHDNKTLYPDKGNLNKVVETILDMHRNNLGV